MKLRPNKSNLVYLLKRKKNLYNSFFFQKFSNLFIKNGIKLNLLKNIFKKFNFKYNLENLIIWLIIFERLRPFFEIQQRRKGSGFLTIPHVLRVQKQNYYILSFLRKGVKAQNNFNSIYDKIYFEIDCLLNKDKNKLAKSFFFNNQLLKSVCASRGYLHYRWKVKRKYSNKLS